MPKPKPKKTSKKAASKAKSPLRKAIKTKAQGNGKPVDESKLSTPMQAGLKAVEFMVAFGKQPPKESKLALVVKMLSRAEGATVDDLAEATGWQRHTVRSALSHALGKKRGYKIVSDKPKGGARIYKIAGQKQ